MKMEKQFECKLLRIKKNKLAVIKTRLFQIVIVGYPPLQSLSVCAAAGARKHQNRSDFRRSHRLPKLGCLVLLSCNYRNINRFPLNLT